MSGVRPSNSAAKSPGRPLVFYLPKPPDIANGRAHWSKVLRDKKAYVEQLRVRMRVKLGFPAAPAAPIARAQLDVVWHFTLPQHRPDPDNVIRRLKPAIDFLVANGFLAGDTTDHVSWSSPGYRFFGDARAELPPLTTVKLVVTPR